MSRALRKALPAVGGVLAIALYGFGAEYAPILEDQSDVPSIGGALARAAVFGVVLLGVGLLRKVRERRDAQSSEVRTTSYERGIM